MPDTLPTTPPAPSPAVPRERGYFNQTQLDDLAVAETIAAAAAANAAALDEQDITATYVEGFTAVIDESHLRITESAKSQEDSKAATELAAEDAAKLHTALQQVQSSAKQKHKMLDEDGDPATNFPTDGYLIGTRLNASRAVLLQSGDTLVLRAKADSLPGFKTPEKIAVVETLLATYRTHSGEKQEIQKNKELAHLTRDELIHVLNTRRSSIQHAADALWPWSLEANRPVRKTFALPLTRPLGM